MSDLASIGQAIVLIACWGQNAFESDACTAAANYVRTCEVSATAAPDDATQERLFFECLEENQ